MSLKLRHEWVITVQVKQYLWLLIHALIWAQYHVSKGGPLKIRQLCTNYKPLKQCIPQNMGPVQLWFFFLQLYHQISLIYVIYSTIFFRVASLALGQSYDCPRASEATLKNMGKIDWYQVTTRVIMCKPASIILGMYCVTLYPLTYFIHRILHLQKRFLHNQQLPCRWPKKEQQYSMGHVTWWSLLKLLSRYPSILVKSL